MRVENQTRNLTVLGLICISLHRGALCYIWQSSKAATLVISACVQHRPSQTYNRIHITKQVANSVLQQFSSDILDELFHAVFDDIVLHSGPMTPYRCSACGEVFDHQSHLIAHLSRVHFRCPVCLVWHTSRAEEVKHWIITQHQWYCTVCKGGLPTKEDLCDHQCEPCDITCPVCKMVAPSQEIYDQHWKDARKDGRHQSRAYVQATR